MKLVLSIFLSLGFLYITYGRRVRINRKFNSTMVNSTKRDGFGKDITDLYKVFSENDARKNAQYFAELIGKVVGGATEKIPVIGAVYSTMVELIFEFTKKAEKSVFEQIEDKVRATIRNEVTKYHFDNMFGSKMLINAIVKEKILTKAQWFLIKSEKYKFLPQLYRTVEYTDSFFPEWEAYTIILMAATIDLISKEQLGKCAIVKEMKALKSEFENGIKSLQLKRLQMLDGHNSYRGTNRDKLYFEDTYDKSQICEGTDCLVKGPGGVRSALNEIADKVSNDAQHFIEAFNIMAESVNKDGRYCFLNSCNCGDLKFPTKGSRFLTRYPDSCMGKGSKKQCEFPCDKYGWGYDWCVVTDDMNNIRYSYNVYEECKKPDWNTCYKITPPYLDEYE